MSLQFPNENLLFTNSYRISRLPIEIWHECWSHSDRDDLRRLVSVCRLFRQLCRKPLFRTLRYIGPDLSNVT
ncbi:hypothetical protein SERLA73DRAFT_185879, partial [Serpula lacrymans var. lacrymans S7.3]